MNETFIFPPRLSDGVFVSHSFETIIERQKRGGETRSGLSSHFIRNYKFDYLLEEDQAQEAIQFLELLSGQIVDFPDWSQSSIVESVNNKDLTIKESFGVDWRSHSVLIVPRSNFDIEPQVINLEDVHDNEISLETEPLINPEVTYLVYPMRQGRAKGLPSASRRTDRLIEFEVEFLETINSRNGGIIQPNMDSISLYRGSPLLDLYWKGKSETWESNISFERAGLGLETPFIREREQKRKFSFEVYQHTREEVSYLIQFFDLVRGRLKGFWLPSDSFAYSLASEAPEGSTSILVKGTALSLAAGTRVGYGDLQLRSLGCEDQYLETSSVEIENGNTRISFETPLTRDFLTNETAIGIIHFVRFANDSLDLKMETDAHARANLSFIELPWEYDVGTNIELYEPIYLYELTGFLSRRWTSYGVSISSLGLEYEAGNIGHGRIGQEEQSLKISCDVTVYPDNDSPLYVFRSGFPLEPMQLKILEVSRNDFESQRIIHRGTVRDLSYNSRGGIKLSIGSAGDAAETEIPRAYVEPRCSRIFLREGCNLVEEDFLVTGLVLEINESSVVSTSILDESNSRGFPDWFSGGVIKIGDERRSIIGQEGNRVLISSPFLNAQVGDVLSSRPTCNRTVNNCRERYNNFNNFGGSPFIPVSNPQLITLRIDTTTGSVGKK